MSFAVGELAVRFGCELRGDPEVRVQRVATLALAGTGDLSFLANPHYRPQLATTHAGAVVLDAASAAHCPGAALISANPYATYARIATLLHPQPALRAGVHAQATLDPSARVAASASVGPQAVIGARCQVGERAQIGAGCILSEDVVVGADCVLHPRVTLERGVSLGARVRVQSGAVIGSDGFGFAREGAAWVAVPQVGSVRIGADVEVGANTTIDRGAIEDTVIAEGVKLDNQIQIAHNVHIGAHTVIAACSGVSGSTHIGARCMIAGKVGIVGHLNICDDVVVTGMSMVAHSIDTPGVYSGGIPAVAAPLWRRLAARFKRLETLAGRVAKLERRSGAGAATGEQQKDEHDE
ncbi:MAG: UDP-3-O-(3-hydroxymyristoyl)glucosamine N-acyltransferase [Steroidobacteraceae bacterium]